METKFDTYYEKEMPYKMSLAELMEVSQSGEKIRYNEQNLLAYIRNCGESFTFLAPINHDSKEKIRHCQLIDPNSANDLYNPLNENNFEEGHWYHPYKIIVTDSEHKQKREYLYFSDFVSLFNNGCFQIVE
jgi:hypothetical protein